MMSVTSNETIKRTKSIALVFLMVAASLSAIGIASAAVIRNYTTGYDPADIAIADFDCDSHMDLAIATESSHRITVLWNDGSGNFDERTDIWVAGETQANAGWTDFANSEQIETKSNLDGTTDIVIYQKNNPFATNEDGSPAGKPGNLTIIESDGCNSRTFTIGERFTHFWAWDMKTGDFNQDGNDDIAILELQPDITTQNIVYYMGPNPTQGQLVSLGPSTQWSFRDFRIGDSGEGTSGLPGDCDDQDLWLMRSEGVDYATGQTTNPSADDNVTIVEHNCATGLFPTSATTSINTVEVQMNNDFGGFDIADISGDGIIDTVTQTNGNTENITWVTRTTSPSVGAWSNVQRAYFGPYIAYEVTVTDLNNDQKPDFVLPASIGQSNTSSSAGTTQSGFYLSLPSSVQVVLSTSGSQWAAPLTYQMGMRCTFADVGQVVGGAGSAPDLVVGYTDLYFGNWADSRGWDAQWDHITVVEMDYKDLEMSSIGIEPGDAFFGVIGEGTSDANISITNTGMEALTGSADVTVTVEAVDEASSVNETVYSNDWDTAEDKSGCGAGCNWESIDYLAGNTNYWHENTDTIQGPESGGEEVNNNSFSANWNGNNPTNFMWNSLEKTNSSGNLWTGTEKNQEQALVLRDVDLTGADRAWMSADIFGSYDFTGLGYASATGGFTFAILYEDAGFIEINDGTGWELLECPFLAEFEGQCPSGEAFWGGYDNDRTYNEAFTGYAEGIYSGYTGTWFGGTHYGWNSYSEDDGDSATDEYGMFDLSDWAGDIVDIRFRFRSGFAGSIGDENESRWSGLDGFAIDNLEISKQNTVYLPAQSQTTSINLNNMQPGESEDRLLSFNFDNDTLYKVTSEISSTSFTGEQVLNNELKFFFSTLNLFDPAVVEILNFKDGAGNVAEGEKLIEAVVEHNGNTAVDFDVSAYVEKATALQVKCGIASVDCRENFEGSSSIIIDNSNGKGDRVNDTSLGNLAPFGSNAYWFGHPDPSSTSSLGYGDLWNETFQLPKIDLTSMTGSFASLSFDYYADTHYYIDTDGSYYNYEDYVVIEAEWKKGGSTYTGYVYGQWTDTEAPFSTGDGDCSDVDTEAVGDSTDPYDPSAKTNLFFNTAGLTESTSIDLTQIWVYNTTSGNFGQECISFAGSEVTLSFIFQSNEDGYNGISTGYLGVGFDNITVRQYTFGNPQVYTQTVTGLGAQEQQTVNFGTHDFDAGTYRIRVASEFDNTTVGTSWYGEEELSTGNNEESVVFTVKSVQMELKSANYLDCVNDIVYACYYPIDSTKLHTFEMLAENGVIPGKYQFNLEIQDSTGSTVFNQSTSQYEMAANVAQKITMPVFDQWVDGEEYKIMMRAYNIDLSEQSGNEINFTATFANKIDVAILSSANGQNRLESVKQDLQGLGLTYTQFNMNEWGTWDTSTDSFVADSGYFDEYWLSYSGTSTDGYAKILLPWQQESEAKDLDQTGRGYYQKIESKIDMIEGFMQAGGTVQMHLGPYEDYYTSQDGRLPYGIMAKDRADADTMQPEAYVVAEELNVKEPFHPILENVQFNLMGGWNPYDANPNDNIPSDSNYVAKGVLELESSTNPNTLLRGALATDPSGQCRDATMNDGTFQNLLAHKRGTAEGSLLGVCNVGLGGMIVTTLDVEKESTRHDTVQTPLLGNMLKYMVESYEDFGEVGNGLGITINGDEPCGKSGTAQTNCDDEQLTDAAMSDDQYLEYYMKSNQPLDISYFSDASSTLSAYWVLDGPTDWDNTALSSSTLDYVTDLQGKDGEKDKGNLYTYVTGTDISQATFCNKVDSASTTCIQDEEWTVTLYLYNGLGQTRAVKIDLITDDVRADAEDPIADFSIDFGSQLTNSTRVTKIDSQTWDGVERDVYQIVLDQTKTTRVYFNASESQDSDALSGSGIAEYKWTITGDYDPTQVTTFQQAHAFPGTSVPLWSYSFENSTVQSSGNTFQKIKVDLIVSDQANKDSSIFRMYFIVVPEGFADEAPTGSWDNAEDMFSCGAKTSNPCKTSSDDYVWINGTVTDGVEDSDFKVEVGLYNVSTCPSDNSVTFPDCMKSSDKFNKRKIGEFDRSDDAEYGGQLLGNGDTFSLKIKISDLYGAVNTSESVTIYWRIDEGGGDQVVSGEMQLTLNNNTVVETSDTTNTGSSDVQSSGDSDMSTIIYIAIGVVALLIVIAVSMMFTRRGRDDTTGFGGSLTEMDTTEAYVQQLISQGYPEDTARAYAQQYAAQASAAAPAAAPVAAAPAAVAPSAASNPRLEAYVQQLISQGYPEATARAHAEQYKDRL